MQDLGLGLSGMSTQRIALVTGANQGLGLSARGRARRTHGAVGHGPAHRPRPARSSGRPPALVAGGPAVARVEGRGLDVRDGDAIAALAAELGEIDIVFSNAAARMSPDADPADEVDAVAETNNLATTRILRAFAPPPASGRAADRRRQRPRHARQARRPGRPSFRRELRTASTTSTRSSPTGAEPSATDAPTRTASAPG